ncbi:amidohydrolase family protein [Mailhella massiliensis]|uniref:Amidohydrolase family protein n=1 Tax=Mailhella massiliensis TaxID=1903261 RepID=A0A921AVH1_9BACT|nr:amidohydrolase family protein [Mailhella massiliensis]HJD96599.1 amidohydrolase family protein [Mailhella massiliensis]
MRAGLKIIDMRCRPPFKAFLNEGYPFGLFDKRAVHKMGYQLSGCPEYSKTLDTHSMEDFFREMDNSGVDIAVAPYRSAWGDREVNHRDPIDNGELVEMVGKYPGKFIAVPGFSPVYHEFSDFKQQVDEYIVNGPLRGMAMEPIIDRPAWLLSDDRAMAMFEVAQNHNIPVLLTYSSMSIPQFESLRVAATTFPKLNFVLCHGGTPRVFEVIDLAFGLGNIYLSPDGNIVNTPWSQMYVDAGNYMLRDRVLFGSAFPFNTMEHAVDYYLHCGFREEILPDILYNNAARLFGLEG